MNNKKENPENNDYYGIFNDKDFLVRVIEKTGEVAYPAAIASEDTIKQILEDKDLLETILEDDKDLKNSFLSGDEKVSIILEQLFRCDNLCDDKEFVLRLLDNMKNLNEGIAETNMSGVLKDILKEKCKDQLQDREVTEKIFDLLENGVDCDLYELCDDLLLEDELKNDKDLAFRYCKIFHNVQNIDESFLEDREFLVSILDNSDIIGSNFQLPAKFNNDVEVVSMYLDSDGDGECINFDALNNAN